jgi:Fur family ferric uptake transcriptional regulator
MSCSQRLSREVRRLGLRLTPQRAVIVETLAHLPGHPSAQQVYERARRRLPGLDRVTVYRTLDRLHRAGMIDRLATRSGLVRYAVHDPARPHHHLACRSCGRVTELPAGALNGLVRRVASQHGFRLDRRHVTLTGLCRDCAADRE